MHLSNSFNSQENFQNSEESSDDERTEIYNFEKIQYNTFTEKPVLKEKSDNLKTESKKKYLGLTNRIQLKKRKFDTTSQFKNPALQKRSKLDAMYEYRPPHLNSNDSTIQNSSNDEGDDNNAINNYHHGQRKKFVGTINSMATLSNMGNSCYLNSVLYSLRFSPFFLHKLHHLIDDMRQLHQKVGQHKIKSSSLGRNGVNCVQGQSGRSWSSKDLVSLSGGSNGGVVSSINEAFPKNNRQIVIEKLHELYQNLNRNELTENSEPFHAGNFLQSIQDVSSVFEGNQQQDAHELLSIILDCLRETCNNLIKMIKDHPDIISDGSIPALESNIVVNNFNSVQQPIQQSSFKEFFTRNRKRKDSTKTKTKPASPIKDKENCQQQSDAIETTSFKCSSNNSLNNNISNNNFHSSNSDSIIEMNDISNAEKEKFYEKIKNLGLNFFREDFEGITLSKTKCLTCETVTEQKETMIDIQIPIPVENSKETENPQLFFQNSIITREYFRTGDVFKCEFCSRQNTEAIRSISFEVLPRLLVLQLKRFSGDIEKINSYIPTPFVLQCFCNRCMSKKDGEKIHTYKLYGIITHVGATLSIGHYIAYTSLLPGFHTEYINCSSEKRKFSLSQTANGSNTAATTNNMGSEKNTGIVKKLIYGRNKASSSGDMSKNLKPINGLSKIMMNGIEKLNLNSHSSNNQTSQATTTNFCQGLNCCSIYLKDFGCYLENHNDPSSINTECNTWYMCDDDKIKILSQKDLEDLLSPNQKLTITPYLLFYARYDLND